MPKQKHIGRSAYRLSSNPKEAVFAESWRMQNERFSTVDWMLGIGITDKATEQQCAEAATIVQWLGSPIGWAWLMDTIASDKEMRKDALDWLESRGGRYA